MSRGYRSPSWYGLILVAAVLYLLAALSVMPLDFASIGVSLAVLIYSSVGLYLRRRAAHERQKLTPDEAPPPF
jgi:hypothetical protein